MVCRSSAVRLIVVALFGTAAVPVVQAESLVCRSFERTGIAGDAAISARPDGTVWYADRRGNRLMRINPDRSITPFVPVEGETSGLSGIAVGSDGQIWYTKDAGNRVGRIPPDGGEGAEYETPQKLSFPASMIADRSGSLWFAARVRNYIGRVEADGSISVYPGPKFQSSPFTPLGMALGADGALWLTDSGHNAVYRFEIATRTFKRFDIATPRAQPEAIIAGADGNAWFVMRAARKIGRITPSGFITEFDLGKLDGGAPRDVVGTPDGTVWFSTSGKFAGRILRDGRIETFPCGGQLGTAVLGPFGKPWFFSGGRVWVVEDADTPRAARQTATAAVAASPWPVAGTKPASDARLAKITLRDAITRLPKEPGRVVLQLTSLDANCTFCLPANTALDAIASRRAGDAAFWRVTYDPWSAAWKDADVNAAGVKGLPTIIVFQNGQEVRRIQGTFAEDEVERQLFESP